MRTADYYKPRCVSCNKKTIVNVIQNMPLGIWVNLDFCYLYAPINVKPLVGGGGGGGGGRAKAGDLSSDHLFS